MGFYVYAVGRSGEGEAPRLTGVFDQPAYRLDVGSLCAVVSECPVATLRPERRHIAATQRVLAAVSAGCDVLPMAFGTITKSKGDVRRFLEDHRETLDAQLRRVSGAIEMSLRLSLEAPDPIAYLVERTPALRAARERAFHGPRPPSHDAKIRLGQMFDDALSQYRDSHTAQVVAVVGESCAEVVALPVRDEREIVNLAALVPRSGLDAFEAAVRLSATEIEEDIAFSLGGPWPPYNFVQFDPGDR
ncbi:MAG: GvpL/GvpF family gas vesicle protein [Roseiarcus sp.]|jgi:hypothetical protein